MKFEATNDISNNDWKQEGEKKVFDSLIIFHLALWNRQTVIFQYGSSGNFSFFLSFDSGTKIKQYVEFKKENCSLRDTIVGKSIQDKYSSK